MFVVMIDPDPSLFTQLSNQGVAVFTLDLPTAKTIADLDAFLQSYSVPRGTLVVNQSEITYTSNEYRIITNFTPHSALVHACTLLGKSFADRQLVFKTTQGYSALGPSGYKAAANSTLVTTTHGLQKPARSSVQIAKAISAHLNQVWLTNTILHNVEDTLVVEVEIPDVKLNNAIAAVEQCTNLKVQSAVSIEHTATTQLFASKRFNSVVLTLVSSTCALSVNYILSCIN